MNALLEWKDFRKTDVPMQDEETGETISEHELFCLWFLYQCHLTDSTLEANTAIAIELASQITQEAPEFDDLSFIGWCLDNLEAKGLIARTKVSDIMTLH